MPKQKGRSAVCGGIGAGVGALPGPGGASEGSRWEASPAGRCAPTGQPVGPDRAPAGAHERPVGMAMTHAPRWGAGHAGPAPMGALRGRSFPPATFIRASSAKASTIRFQRKQGRTKQKGHPEGRPLNYYYRLAGRLARERRNVEVNTQASRSLTQLGLKTGGGRLLHAAV